MSVTQVPVNVTRERTLPTPRSPRHVRPMPRRHRRLAPEVTVRPRRTSNDAPLRTTAHSRRTSSTERIWLWPPAPGPVLSARLRVRARAARSGRTPLDRRCGTQPPSEQCHWGLWARGCALTDSAHAPFGSDPPEIDLEPPAIGRHETDYVTGLLTDISAQRLGPKARLPERIVRIEIESNELRSHFGIPTLEVPHDGFLRRRP